MFYVINSDFFHLQLGKVLRFMYFTLFCFHILDISYFIAVDGFWASHIDRKIRKSLSTYP